MLSDHAQRPPAAAEHTATIPTTPPIAPVATPPGSTTAPEAGMQKRLRGFCDLPPELRNEVYRYVVAGTEHGRQYLVLPQIPHLARTIKLIRKEFLPVFFAASHFLVHVGTNSNEPGDKAKRIAGRLGLAQGTRTRLQPKGRHHHVARIKHVTFLVYASGDVEDARSDDPQRQISAERFLLTRMVLSVEGGAVSIKRLKGSDHPGLTEVNFPEKFERRYKAVVDIVQEIGRLEEFNGFTLNDLDTISTRFETSSKGSKRWREERGGR